MTTCATCRSEIGDTFAFCPYCGASQAEAAPREQRKRVTILFCDITGSTALGESIDPEALRILLARYFERMKGIVERHGGTVEKFIGDAVLAVFGVPTLHEDDALRAARAAVEMQAAVPELGLQTRIGVNTGEVVTSERLATGDAVNVAARLEQAAAPGEVLLGEETVRLLRDAVEVEAVPLLQLKGKSRPVPGYRLLGLTGREQERSHTTPMIGRQRELRRLHDAYAQAVDNRSCQLFTILGTAGVGKSRLAEEFLASVDGARVVRGRCLSYGEGITYRPIAEVIEQLDAQPSDTYAATTLQSLLGESKITTTAEEIAWSFRKLLEEQARDRSLSVVFDDIHWGEEAFLDLVEHIADLSRDAPILLLCMARAELLEKRPGWGGGKWNATTVLLEPLDAGETDQLLDALGGVEDAFRGRVLAAAEGNPLFVEEMVALLKEAGGEEVTVPPTIQALLAARLDRLDPSERRVLECGAVEGRVFRRSALQVLVPDRENLQRQLMGLVRKELVRPAPADLAGDEAYRFRHDLIRDAAYSALPKSVRADLHERFAGWREEQDAQRAELDEIVGYHLERAAGYKQELGHHDTALAERAGERLAVAGRQARWRGDVRAARGLFERAVTLLRPLRFDPDLELDLADAQPSVPEASAMAEQVAERARVAHDRRGEMVAKVVIASHRLALASTGSAEELETLAREALPLLEEADDHAGLVRVWTALGDIANLHGHYEEWAHAAEQTIFHTRQVGGSGLFHLPVALIHGPRLVDAALQELDALLTEDPLPGPSPDRAVLLAMLGRFEEAWATVHEANRWVLELTGEEITDTEAEIATLAGDHETAAHFWVAYCARLERQGRLATLSTYASRLGRSLCKLGRYDEAEPLADRGRQLGAEGDVVTQILWRQVQALVCAQRGEHAEAVRLAREAVAIVEQTDTLNWQGDALCDLAEVLQQAGHEQEAVATLEEALERYERKQNLAMATQVRQRLGASELGRLR